VFIGSGSVLRNGITIGDNCIIGMGAVVTKSIGHGLKVFGNPAK
jgi:maltose O-acetyltransferase